jgi:hypothetical protein
MSWGLTPVLVTALRPLAVGCQCLPAQRTVHLAFYPITLDLVHLGPSVESLSPLLLAISQIAPEPYQSQSLTTRFFNEKLKFFSRQILHPHFLRKLKTLTCRWIFHGLTFGSVVSRLHSPLATPLGLSLSPDKISKKFSISHTLRKFFYLQLRKFFYLPHPTLFHQKSDGVPLTLPPLKFSVKGGPD